MTTSRERRGLHTHQPGARERFVVLAAFAALFIGFLLVLSVAGAGAESVFKVDDKTDAVDTQPGDGKCESTHNKSCTLRAAVMEAGIAGGSISLPAGTFKLTIPGAEEVGEQFLANQPDAAKGDLDISKRIAISGEGAGKTVIDAGGKMRIFDVHAPDGNLLLSDARLTGGLGDFDKASGHYHGGAVHNHAYANLSRVVVDNSSSPVTGEGTTYCDKQFTPQGCLQWGGGGITNASNGVAGLNDVTIARNRTSAQGGGIENLGRLTIFRTTVAENTAPADKGGGIWRAGGSLVPDHTLIAKNTGGDCGNLGGTVSENTHSLQGDGTCGFGGQTDQTTDPKFESGLAGAPLYYALSKGSVAVDGGTETCQSDEDVRGVSRPQDGNNDGKALCDIGSYELEGSAGGKPTLTIADAKVTDVGPETATAAQRRRPPIGILRFAVKLSKASKKVVTVRAKTDDRTAQAGLDYVKKLARLRFKPGETKKRFVVPVLTGRRPEGAETLRVKLFDATNARIRKGVGVGTILTR